MMPSLPSKMYTCVFASLYVPGSATAATVPTEPSQLQTSKMVGFVQSPKTVGLMTKLSQPAAFVKTKVSFPTKFSSQVNTSGKTVSLEAARSVIVITKLSQPAALVNVTVSIPTIVGSQVVAIKFV